MNVETINEKIKSTALISDEKKVKIVEGDVLVPDIKPDILSLVSVEDEAYITSEKVEDGKLHIQGIVDISVIYMSEDENASLKSLSNTFDFYETLSIEGISENSIVDVSIVKGPLECKVLNARKINVKAPVTLDAKVLNNQEYEIAKDVVDDRNIELQKKKVTLNILCDSKKQDVELKENINLNEDSPAISEVLKASIRIVNEDYKISYNKILAKADAIVKIVYIADNDRGSLESFEASVPIMGFIDFDGISDDMDVKLKYNIKSFILRPIYQDMKSISFSIESDICIKAFVYQKSEIEIISDLYNPDMELKCDEVSITLNQNVIDQTDRFEMMQGMLIPEMDSIKILSIDVLPNISSKNILDGKLALEGNIDFDILYYNETKRVMENKKMELPFQQVIKIPNLQSNMDVDVKINVCSVEYQKIDASQIQIKVVLEVKTLVKNSEVIKGIINVEMCECKENNIASIIIYYVKPGDTLWNIAKKYKTTVKEIMEYNGLKDDLIYPNQQLIIPKRVKKAKVELMI